MGKYASKGQHFYKGGHNMMVKELKTWKALFVVTFLVLLLAFTPRLSSAAGPSYGGHLRVAYGLEASSLDPHLGRSGGDAYYWKQMFDHIVAADSKLVSQERISLAESWEIPDPKTMVFHLRKGVKFHDGTDFNADAIKFNIDRMLAPDSTATPKASFSVIDRVEVVDPYTAKFHLKRPWGAGLSMIADRGGTVNSPAAIKKHGKAYGFNPVGTGCCRVECGP
jgi:ABC-type transport system substrate-binding protein